MQRFFSTSLSHSMSYYCPLPCRVRVDCEREFRVMNFCKSFYSLSNRLSMERMSQPMCIQLNGPSREQFDFKAAFVEWSSLKDRRIICTNA